MFRISTNLNGAMLYDRERLHAAFFLMLIVLALLVGVVVALYPGRGGIAFGIGVIATVFLFAFIISGEDYPSIRSFCFTSAAIYAVFVIVWPRYGSLPFNFLPVRNPRRALFVLAVILSIFAIMLSKDARLQLKRVVDEAPTAFKFLSGYLIWRILSLFAADDFTSALLSLTIELTGVFSAVIVWSISLPTAKSFTALLKIISAVTVIACVLVAVEGIKARNLYLEFLKIDPNESAYFSFLFDRVRDGVYRAQGAFEHPLLLTEFIIFALPISVALLSIERNLVRKLIWGASILGLLVASYFVRSRSSFLFIGIVSSLGVLLVILRVLINGRSLAKWFLPLALAIPSVVLIFYSAPLVIDVVYGGTVMERLSTATRLLMIERGVHVIISNPVFGIGPGSAALALGIFSSQGLPICDNYYLQVAMESGVPALVLFVCFWGLIIPKAIGFVLFHSYCENVCVAIGVLIGVLGILLFKFVMAESQNFDFLFLGFVGLLILERDSVCYKFAPRDLKKEYARYMR